MEKSVEIKAASVELATEQALIELGTTADKVEVEVISKGGLFSKAQVRVTKKDGIADKVEDFVNGILKRMELFSRAVVTEEENSLKITIAGEDSGAAIGFRGEVLDAIQYLVLTYLNSEKSDFKKVSVDCENYREKRRETLTALALRLAEKAHRTCRKIPLEPMNPFERRIIHSALVDSEIAETISEGEDSDRHVVIIPKGVEIREDRPRRNDQRGGDRRGGGYRGGSGGGRGSYGRDSRGGRNDARDRGERRERAPREETEVEDGREFRGYYTSPDEFKKPERKKNGPPKFKSFGGQKKL